MDVVPALTNAIPLLIVTIIGGWLLKDRFDRLEARFETELAALRSDLTHVALAVGARTRPQTG